MEIEYFYSFIYILISLVILKFFYYKRIVSIISPVDMYILFFSAVIILNILYRYYPKDQKFDMYNLDTFNNKNFPAQLNVFFRMMTLFLIGVFIFSIRKLKYLRLSSQKIEIINIKKAPFNYVFLKNAMIFLLYTCIILVAIDYKSDFFYRINYIPHKSSVLKSIYTVLLIVLSILAAISFNKNKIISFFTITIVLLIGIGLGSRMATVNLITFIFSYSFMIKDKRTKIKYFFVWIPIIIFFFGYNIALRLESNTHGLVPYLNIILSKPDVIFHNTLFNIYYTFIFGFVATSETIKLYQENISNLLTCINPLPGSLTNWYLFSQKLRINIYAPFTAIGEMAKFPVFSFFYYIFLGYYFSFCDFYIKTAIIAKRYFAPAIIIILLCLFILFSFEYNLRSSIRYIYYSAFILFLSKIKINGKS
ncbi:O-antigen polymerase [Flavobacterium sp.]|uniref:O-antigen polymerase n=1 Tax=Flavobacterium sp. TaxID=239 RepID=UPI003341C7D9